MGKNIAFVCLEGAIISTPEAAAQGQALLAQQRTQLLNALSSIPTETGNSASAL
jgi:hypothetical protein